jgi:NAD(P)-dependent dehydrogenase (short-subunit alcohol dehydrogenase family)
MKSLENKIAIVTGAADGMGLGITTRFLEQGAKVVATDVNAEKLTAALGGESDARTLAIDITADGAAQAIVDLAVEQFGGIDILVNAAGIFRFMDLESMALEDWYRTLDVNLHAPFKLSIAAVPHLKSSSAGRIINIASTNGHRANYGATAYTVSKHAIVGLTKSLAVDLAQYGITVNSIDPGCIVTGITRELMKNPDMVGYMEKQAVLNRLGTVDEIAQAALYLAGPNSGFTTGHGLAVDGGFLMAFPKFEPS